MVEWLAEWWWAVALFFVVSIVWGYRDHDEKELAEYLHTLNLGILDGGKIIAVIAAMPPAQLRVRSKLYPLMYELSQKLGVAKKLEAMLSALQWHEDKTSAELAIFPILVNVLAVIPRLVNVGLPIIAAAAYTL